MITKRQFVYVPPSHDHFAFQWLSFVLFFVGKFRNIERRGKRVAKKITIHNKRIKKQLHVSHQGYTSCINKQILTAHHFIILVNKQYTHKIILHAQDMMHIILYCIHVSTS